MGIEIEGVTRLTKIELEVDAHDLTMLQRLLLHEESHAPHYADRIGARTLEARLSRAVERALEHERISTNQVDAKVDNV